MVCKNCHSDIQEYDKSYKCNQCGLTIWKSISGHKLTAEELRQLLEKGETELITFINRNTYKPYKAKLVLKDSKVNIEYDDTSVRRKLQDVSAASNEIPDQNAIKIRVESQHPGFSSLTINSTELYYHTSISFGLTSTREAECLSLTAAADYIKFHDEAYKEKNLYIEVNSQELAYYLLKETKPRDKQMQYIVAYTWGKLAGFSSYDIVYKPKKRAKLTGTNLSRYYPKGLFPCLEKLTYQDAKILMVYLPCNLAICKQFTASFPKAILAGTDNQKDSESLKEFEAYSLPIYLISKVENWFNIVTSKPAH